MKKILVLLAALFVAAPVCTAQTMPDVKVENAAGELVSTQQLVDGKPFIVSFWSLTCKPCIMELNAINDQLDEWREQVDFKVVAVSVDDVRASSRARALANGRAWDFTCLYDKNQDLRRAMNVSLTPQTYVVDQKGNIVYSHSGYTPGSELELLDKLKEISK